MFCDFSQILKKVNANIKVHFVLNEVIPQRSLKVTKDHFYIYRSTYSQIYDICCFSNLILPKFGINANITKMQIFDDMKFNLGLLSYGQLLSLF